MMKMTSNIKNLHIVHFAKYYLPDWGGIENVTESLAKGAVKRGAKVDAICFDRHNMSDEIIDGVNVIRCKERLKPASQPLGLRYMLQCLKKGRTADIIHIHAPNMLAALLCAFIPKRVKILVHWHSDIVGKGLAAKITRPLEKLMLKRAEKIVCTTEAYAQASVSLENMQDKVITIPLGIADPIKDLPTIPAPLPKHIYAQVCSRKIILSIGRMVPYKGYDVLIDAVDKIDSGAVCIAVGTGPLETKLREKIKSKQLEDKILFVGNVNMTELSALLQNAHLFCMSSVERSEAFGVVLLEAMAYELPIVATKIIGSGVSWVNAHDISGINVETNDPNALAAACNNIIVDTKLHKRLAKGARNRFKNVFTEETSIEHFIRVYEKIV